MTARRLFEHALVQPHHPVHLRREPLVVGRDQSGAAFARGPGGGIRRRRCRRWPRRDCRSARRRAPGPGGWRARGRPRRAAARRRESWLGRWVSRWPRPSELEQRFGARARVGGLGAVDQLRQDDILGRAEIGQQMVELVDEAQARRGAAGCGRHCRAARLPRRRSGSSLRSRLRAGRPPAAGSTCPSPRGRAARRSRPRRQSGRRRAARRS